MYRWKTSEQGYLFGVQTQVNTSVAIALVFPLSQGRVEHCDQPTFYIQSKLAYLSIGPSATRQASKINTWITSEIPSTMAAEKASRRDRHCIASIEWKFAAKIWRRCWIHRPSNEHLRFYWIEISAQRGHRHDRTEADAMVLASSRVTRLR